MLRGRGAFGVLFGAAVLGLLPAQAQAVVTAPQTVTIPATDTDFSPGTAMVFNQFNPALGTLNAVTMTLSYDFIHTSTVTFFTPGTITTDANGNAIKVELPNQQTLLSASGPDYSKSVTFNSATMQLFQPITFPSVTTTGSLGPIALTDSATLSAFKGTGTIGLPVLATSMAVLPTNNANGAAGVTTKADVKLTISYSYQPAVPEPSSVVLLGLGACGLLLVRRRYAA